MFTLNIMLRDFVRTTPIAASFVMTFALSGRDPNEFSINEYVEFIRTAKRNIMAAPLPKREDYPAGELGETIYRDIRAQHFINLRVFAMEQPPLEGSTFGELLNDWRNKMQQDHNIAEYTKALSPLSIDYEARNIALATHRVN